MKSLLDGSVLNFCDMQAFSSCRSDYRRKRTTFAYAIAYVPLLPPTTHYHPAVNKTIGFNNGQVHVCQKRQCVGWPGVSCHYVCTFIKKLLHNESLELALQIVDAIYNSAGKSLVRYGLAIYINIFVQVFGQKWFFEVFIMWRHALAPPTFPFKWHSFHLENFLLIASRLFGFKYRHAFRWEYVRWSSNNNGYIMGIRTFIVAHNGWLRVHSIPQLLCSSSSKEAHEEDSL